MEEEIEVIKAASGPEDSGNPASAIVTIPSIGDDHPEFGPNGKFPKCINIDAKQRTDSPFLWTVECTYSTTATPSAEDPTQRLAEIHWGQVDYQKPVEQALFYPSGGGMPEIKPPVNSAGDKFDPPVMMDAARPMLTVVKNKLRFPRALQRTHVNKTNIDVFCGYPAGQVKCQSISGDLIREANRSYWRVTYIFHFDSTGWILRILDHGTREIKAIGAEMRKVEIRDPAGSQASSYWPLNGSGVAVLDRNGPFTYLNYDPYGEATFSLLGLNDDLPATLFDD
jgi:hypothetical protein